MLKRIENFNMYNHSNQIVTAVKDIGFYRLKNFLSPEEVKAFIHNLNPFLKDKGSPETRFATSYKIIFYKILKLDFKKAITSSFLKRFVNKKKLIDIADQIFEKKSYNNMIDCYYSPKSNSNVLPWHIDLAYSGKENISISKIYHPDAFSIKFFIYLTPVGPNNGCTSFIPESHKVTYALRKGLKDNILTYEPHWSLEQLLDFIKKNISYFENYFKGTEILKNFFKNTEGLDNSNTSKFDFFMEAGDAIIFDEGGVHKGSMPSKNDRAVVRFHYKIKEELLN